MVLAAASCVFVGVDVHGNPEPKAAIFAQARIFSAFAIDPPENGGFRQ